MYTRQLIVTCIILLTPLFIQAQTVKLKSSSKTSWSGGIAGRYGANYIFAIEFSDCGEKEPVPDAIWIGNKCIPVVLKGNGVQQNYNTIRTAGTVKVSFTITAGTNHQDDHHYPDPYGNENAKTVVPVPPIKYKGVALLSYKYDGKQKYFVIGKIMKNNPPISYP